MASQLTVSCIGRQQTEQSSMYSWIAAPPGSTAQCDALAAVRQVTHAVRSATLSLVVQMVHRTVLIA